MKNIEYISKHGIIRKRKEMLTCTHILMSDEKRAKEQCT
jgi:hypothetical protein